MGSYATLYVGGLEIGSTKNDIDPVVMILFRAEDWAEEVLRPGTPAYAEYWASEPVKERTFDVTRVMYRARAVQIADRLDLMGFTREACRSAMRIAIEREIVTLDGYARRGGGWADELGMYRALTPELWMDAVGRFVRQV